MRTIILLTLLTAVTSPLTYAQMSMPAPARPDTRPVPLVTGIGNSHHTIATTSPEAQRYFNQGLDYIFAFNHDEARRSFARAAQLDPPSSDGRCGESRSPSGPTTTTRTLATLAKSKPSRPSQKRID